MDWISLPRQCQSCGRSVSPHGQPLCPGCRREKHARERAAGEALLETEKHIRKRIRDDAPGPPCMTAGCYNAVNRRRHPFAIYCDDCTARLADDKTGAHLDAGTIDLIDSPPHYTQGPVECWDALHSALGTFAFLDHCRATAIAYLWRAGKKNDCATDFKKAIAWLEKGLSVERGRGKK